MSINKPIRTLAAAILLAILGAGNASAEVIRYDDPNVGLVLIDTELGSATVSNVSYSVVSSGTFTIPDNVTYQGTTYPLKHIGKLAFTGMSTLQMVFFGANIESVDSAAFKNNSTLQLIAFNSKLTTLGDNAFSGCSKLTSLTLPATLRNIGVNPFVNCTSLTTLSLSGTSAYFSAADGILFNKDKTAIICYPNGKTANQYTVPSGVKTIAKSAFFGSRNLYSVTLPDGLKEIQDQAFAVCALGSIDIPATVETIGANPWYSNGSLTSIKINGGTDSDFFTVSNNWLLTADKKRVISTTWRGGKAYIPDDVEEIGDYLLYYQPITGIELPLNLKKIGDYAFYQCSNLKSITFYDGLEEIGDMSFQSSGLKTLDLPTSVKKIGVQAFSSTALTDLVLNEGLQSLGINAFINCASLKSVELPSTLVNPGANIFANCTALTKAKLAEGMTVVPEGCFLLCTALTNVTLPSTITAINNLAFNNTSALKSITIPEGCTEIGEGAFEDSGLLELTLPNSVKRIDRLSLSWLANLTSLTTLGLEEIAPYAIHYNYELTNIALNEGLRSIGTAGISGLPITSLTIPSTVNFIDATALLSNYDLADLYMLPTTPPTTPSDIFATDTPVNFYEQVTLHVPSGSLEEYKSHPIYSKFSNILADVASIDTIPGEEATIEAFYNIQGIRLEAPSKGLNIIKMSDGSTRKVIVK